MDKECKVCKERMPKEHPFDVCPDCWEKEAMKITMRDGSVYVMPNETWQEAFEIKARAHEQTIEETVEQFVSYTAEGFENKTELTKFGVEPWSQRYETHAQLGHTNMYAFLRAYLFSLVFKKLAKPGKEPVRVVVPTEDGMKEIPNE